MPLGSCKTCSLMYNECPGHMGHIELPAPLYNPLLFRNLYQVLRAHCFHCGHFKMARDRVHVFTVCVFQWLDVEIL
jgi:DNA-directed RNA polymerase I subunit RPA1